LKASLPEAAAGSAQFRDVRAGLAALERRCRSAESPRAAPAVAAGERVATGKPAPATPKPAPAQQRCPGSRPMTEAPQLVMVFDASGSMKQPINASAQALRQLEQLGSGSVGAALGLLGRALETAAAGPTRMQAAKDAGQRIIRGLPGDIDVGLVKIENCPAATDAGFYAPARRGPLLSRINALQPRAKTPLASAIARAAGMVDGVERPALIAVISDGEDTCGGNVCRVAERIAASKPRLKINVVDITGTGAADCAARATGGRVLRADNAESLGAQMQRATEEVAGPAHCRGG
jgi:Mg-chelatase subunit ChlD